MDDSTSVKSMVTILIIIGIGIGSFLAINSIKKNKKIINILHRKYMLQLIQLLIILFCIVRIIGIVNPNLNVHSLLLTGSALIVAIVGFAAQTAISDIICGFLISMNKPFEIGDRIIIEGLDPGIVEDITLRHIVIAIYDDLKIIVPNSKLNTKTLINTSYQSHDKRGIHLQFNVSYDTDIPRAIDVIRDCVAESPYTLGVVRNGILEDSGPVYLLNFSASSAVLETTIIVPKTVSGYVATTDVNIRVLKAFRDNNIEIPYNYINVIDAGQKETSNIVSDQPHKKVAPSKRHFRTNNITLSHAENDIEIALKLANQFSTRQSLNTKDTHKLEHLTEESILFIKNAMGSTNTLFWIEGSGISYKIHFRFTASIGSKEYKKLLELSSTGKNEAVKSVPGRVFEAMRFGLESIMTGNSEQFEWKLSQEHLSSNELSESILAAMAGEITVHIAKDQVEFIVSNS